MERLVTWRTLSTLIVAVAIAGCGGAAELSPAPTAAQASPTLGPTLAPSPTGTPSFAASAPPTPASSAPADLAMSTLPRTLVSPDEASKAARAINAFGLDLYRRVAEPGDNVVLSPTSVAIALAMARAGARGETAGQMDAVMHAAGADTLADAMNALDAALASRSGTFDDPGGNPLEVTLRIANATFAQRGMSIEPAFLDALAARFGAGVRLVDYEADPEAARQAVNAWWSSRPPDGSRSCCSRAT